MIDKNILSNIEKLKILNILFECLLLRMQAYTLIKNSVFISTNRIYKF